MHFRKFQPWERDALVRALQAQPVLNGVARCIEEERVVILQLVRRKTTNRVTVVQYPQPSVQAAYDRLKDDDMQPSDFVAYFIVASAPALLRAEVDGTPVMRTLRPEGRTSATHAEILRTPYTVQFGGGR
ncbi:hypothetical protein ACWEQU_05750 [Streptomyces nodosus]